MTTRAARRCVDSLLKGQTASSRLLLEHWGVLLPGFATFCIGLIISLGWVLRLPRIMNLRPGWGGMVLMTSVSALLSGAALLAAAIRNTRLAFRIQHWLGGIVLSIAATAAAETLTNRNLGIDFSALHLALLPDYFPPGRMAPNTNLNFLLIGLALELVGICPARRSVRGLSALVFVVGAIGFLAYRLQLQYIFGWYAVLGLVRMSLPTCVCMMLIAAGLWSISKPQHQPGASNEEGLELRTIFSASGSALLVTALATGINGLGLMQDSISRTTSNHLSELAQNQGLLIDESIQLQSNSAAFAASGDSAALQMHAWGSGLAANATAAARLTGSTVASALRARGAKLLQQGFSGVVYRLSTGRSIQIGRMIDSSPIRAPTRQAVRGELVWSGGYFLSTIAPIWDEEGIAGEMLAQQPMPVLDRLARETSFENETGKLALCTPMVQAGSANCFPMSYGPFPLRTALPPNPSSATDRPSISPMKQPSPIGKALAGQSGTMLTRDSLGEPITAAYRPLRNASLGLMLTVDTVETYAPLRHSIEVALPLTIAVILVSLWMMRWRLAPLVDGLVRSREQIRELALHDPLTGLPNRTLMEDRLQMAFGAARRSGGFVALGLVDLDGFKQVNDVLGHEAGDELLKIVAVRLVEAVRASDTVARLGGDEFVIILPDVLVPDAVLGLGNKILAVFSKPVAFRAQQYSIRLSIGFAVSTSGNQDRQLLLRQADTAMYFAKESGGNRAQVYDPDAFHAKDEAQVGNPGTEDAKARRTLVGATRAL